jgi:hypothetical protein
LIALEQVGNVVQALGYRFHFLHSSRSHRGLPRLPSFQPAAL